MKANLTGIPETLFIILRMRAIETMHPRDAVMDPYAMEILNSIEFDDSAKNKVLKGSQTGTIARTLILDEIIINFLSKYPQGTIVNLGCGLDARCKRLPQGDCRWFDIEYCIYN